MKKGVTRNAEVFQLFLTTRAVEMLILNAFAVNLKIGDKKYSKSN